MSRVEKGAQESRLAGLEALRDTLARAIDECDSLRDLAALSNRLTDVLEQIADLTPVEKVGDPIDEVTARRTRRRSGAATG